MPKRKKRTKTDRVNSDEQMKEEGESEETNTTTTTTTTTVPSTQDSNNNNTVTCNSNDDPSSSSFSRSSSIAASATPAKKRKKLTIAQHRSEEKASSPLLDKNEKGKKKPSNVDEINNIPPPPPPPPSLAVEASTASDSAAAPKRDVGGNDDDATTTASANNNTNDDNNNNSERKNRNNSTPTTNNDDIKFIPQSRTPEMREALYQYFTGQKTAEKARRMLKQQKKNEDGGEDKNGDGGNDTNDVVITPRYFWIVANRVVQKIHSKEKGKYYDTPREIRSDIKSLTDDISSLIAKQNEIKLGIETFFDEEASKVQLRTKKAKTGAERSRQYIKDNPNQVKINNQRRDEKKQQALLELYTYGSKTQKKVSPSVTSIQFFKSTTKIKQYSDAIDEYIRPLKPTKSGESYSSSYKKPEDVPATRYDNYHLCSSDALNALESEYKNDYIKGNNKKEEFSGLGILGNGEHGRDKSEFHKFNSTLEEVRELTLRSNIETSHKFRYATAHSYIEKQDITENQDILDMIQSKDLFKYDMRMCEIHDSKDPIERLEFYPEHKEKVGNLVCFWGTYGYSYNFIVYPRETPVDDTDNDDVTEYGIEKAPGTSWEDYDCWRQQLKQQHEDDKKNNGGRRRSGKKDDFDRLQIFESTLRKNNKDGKAYFGIRVYKVCKGNRLVFPAKYYKHGTIVPKQGTKRTLGILYCMEVQKNS